MTTALAADVTVEQAADEAVELQAQQPKRVVRRLKLPPLRPFQLELARDPARDACTVSATQVGKTFCLACWLLAKAWESRVTLHPWWWTAPTYNQVVAGFRLVASLAGSAGILNGPPTTTPYPVVRLINGVNIEFRSWEREQNLMGTTISGGVVDEAGLLTPQAQAAISTRRSGTMGPLRYIGNPGLVAGPFRKLCTQGEEAKREGSFWYGKNIYSIHKWTWEDKYKALLAKDVERAEQYKTFIDQEKISFPEFEFRRLYEAEWTEDEAAVFRGAVDCVERGAGNFLKPEEDQFVLGVDVAQMSDYFCVVSQGVNSRRIELRDRFRGVGYPQAALRLKQICDELKPSACVVEINGPGAAVVIELDRLNVPYVPFTTTLQSKQEAVLSLAADIQEKRVKIADHAPMPTEFMTYRYQRTPVGLYRYSAPPGEHDDTVMAAVLANWGVRKAAFSLDQMGWIA